jgi:hypothetical protein
MILMLSIRKMGWARNATLAPRPSSISCAFRILSIPPVVPTPLGSVKCLPKRSSTNSAESSRSHRICEAVIVRPVVLCRKITSNSNKTRGHVHDLSLQQTLSKYNGSWVGRRKPKRKFYLQSPAMFVFVVFHKRVLIESCSSFEDLSLYKISWSQVDCYKSCIHHSSLNASLSPSSKDQLK